MRLFSKPKKLRLREDEGAPTWQLLANRSNPSGELSWQLPVPGEGNNRQLVADWWKTYRFLVEVNPQRGTWRTTIANRQQSITNELTDAIDLFNAAESDMTLCFEATGKTGKAVRFSLDEIRIQNHPDTVSKTAK